MINDEETVVLSTRIKPSKGLQMTCYILMKVMRVSKLSLLIPNMKSKHDRLFLRLKWKGWKNSRKGCFVESKSTDWSISEEKRNRADKKRNHGVETPPEGRYRFTRQTVSWCTHKLMKRALATTQKKCFLTSSCSQKCLTKQAFRWWVANMRPSSCLSNSITTALNELKLH